MKYYRNPESGAVYAYEEDGSQDAFMRAGLVPMAVEEVEAHLNPSPTQDQIKTALSCAVQNHMDAAAQAAGYDDIKSAVTYADEPAVARFQAEGQAFRAWRSLCWAACYGVMAQVEGGEREVPTVDELIAGLPSLELSS